MSFASRRSGFQFSSIAAAARMSNGLGDSGCPVVPSAPSVKIHFMNDYAPPEHHECRGAARQAREDPPLQAALIRLTGTLMAGNRRGYAALTDSSRLRDHAKRIKEHSLAHLDRYLEQLEASVQRV